jgi:membrane-associated phospholipid phosphatase
MLEGLFDESRSARVTTRPLLRQSPQSPPARPHIAWGLRRGLLVVAAACALLVWVTQRVFVQSARGQGWDEGWRTDVAQAAGKVWEARAHEFGVVSLRLGLFLCLVLALIALARQRMDLFVRGAVVVAGANATTQILKRVVIERPDFSVGYGPNALPSGHVTLVASIVIAALIVLPAAIRPLVALVGGAWVVVVSVATVVSGWHRPSDVVAALLVCAGWAALVGSVRTTTRWTYPATAR